MLTQQRDSATTEPSISSFASFGIAPSTVRTLAKMDIHTPTPIQAAGIPPLLAGRDLIGQARTGSGKTLAFVVPALEIVDYRRKAVQALILTPTRELAIQIGEVVDQLGKSQRINSVLVYGGRSARMQIQAIDRGAQVVIGTPGRILDLIGQGALRLDQLRLLVIDEADGLLDHGFGPDVERIISHTSPRRQTALFSATVPGWVQEVSAKHLNHPVHVQLDVRPEDKPDIDHLAILLPDHDKTGPLQDLLDEQRSGSIIVFGRTKHGVRKLAKRLGRDGYSVAALQGNLSQNARERVMDQFRSGKVQVLVATNVAARGLDVSEVDLVINLELPESSDLLTHRIGRTGRMGRTGRAITLLNRTDQRKWRQLERDLGQKIPRTEWKGAQAALEIDPAELASQTLERPARSQKTTGSSDPHRNSSRPARRQHRRSSHSRRHHSIVCDACGETDTVPFKPDPTRKIYCRDCFKPARNNRRPKQSRTAA